jgi:hypothetical protein
VHLFAAAVEVLRLIIGLRLVILRAEPSTSGIPIKPKQQASVIGEAKATVKIVVPRRNIGSNKRGSV